MFNYIHAFFSDPKGMLLVFLLAFPGRILALSVHEFAHAWVANRCGDSTAKSLGRMTLNPLKHLDPVGTILMLVAGFGWAKPVPVNPRNYRNYRRDDFLVSVAGVTMNLIMFVLSVLLMFIIMAATLSRVPEATFGATDAEVFRTNYFGTKSLFFLAEDGEYYRASIAALALNLPYISDVVIAPVYGKLGGYLYQMLAYFSIVNLSLCLFNLIPIPPLDGYHVLNDLVLRRDLFASARISQISYLILVALMATGALSEGLGWVNEQVIGGVGRLAQLGLGALGLL